MAFGIDREELTEWKVAVGKGNMAFLTHYWLDERFPGCKTVTKAGCADVDKLVQWGMQYGLKAEWIDMHKDYRILIYLVHTSVIFYYKRVCRINLNDLDCRKKCEGLYPSHFFLLLLFMLLANILLFTGYQATN